LEEVYPSFDARSARRLVRTAERWEIISTYPGACSTHASENAEK
jgi:hypothetical protein